MDNFYDDDKRLEHAKRVKLRGVAMEPADRSILGDLPPSVDSRTLAGQLYGGDSAAGDLLFDDYDDEIDW